MAQSQTKKLGAVLQDAGLITAEQLQTALKAQRATGARLGEALVSLGYVTEKDMHRILAVQLGLDYVTLNDISLDPQAARLIPEPLAKRNAAIPIKREGNRLTVATSDPLNIFARTEIKVSTGLDVDRSSPILCVNSPVRQSLRK